MLIRRLITVVFLAVIFGLPFFNSALASSEDPVRLINLSSSGHEQGVAVAFSPGGEQIAVGLSSGIALYNSKSLVRDQFIETGTWARSVMYSPDGLALAAGLFDGTAQLWRLADGSHLHTFKGHTGWVRSVIFSRNGKFLITAADDDTVRVWNLSNGSLELTINHLSGVRVVTLSPDDQTLAVGLQDSTIRLLNVSNGNLVKTLSGHKDWVRSLAFSPDGHKLASGAFDATARLWDVGSGRLEHTFLGHESSVLGLAFSPDGSTLATGSVDRTVKLWNVPGRNLIRTFIGHTDFVYGVAFSPDGTILASSSSDNTARLWNLLIPEKKSLSQAPTSSDCRDCHHPLGDVEPPRVIQVNCEACHAGGIGLNWCVAFSRSKQAVSEAHYSPLTDPIGVPVSSENIAVQINYPTNGETLYGSERNLSPAFVKGRVFYSGDPGDIKIQMEIWAGGQLVEQLSTQADQDGGFTFSVAINPNGAMIVAGAKAADPDCVTCHEGFKSQASFPNGEAHLVIRAISPSGDQAMDERWITVDTSGRTKVDVRVVDSESGIPISGLLVRASAILYEWRDRYATQVSDVNGTARLSLESLSQSGTRYEITVPPASLNGYLYESVDPVILDLSPGATMHDPITIRVDVKTGKIAGRLTGVDLTAPLVVWAVRFPDGAYHKASAVNGQFIFDTLPSGEYKVFVDPSIEQFGYHAAPIQVDLTKEARAAVNIKLNKIATSSLSGRTYDEDGMLLPFGWITAASEQTVQLDPFKGTFHISGLGSVKVAVILDAPGYYSQAQVVDLSDEQNENLSFSLVLRPETMIATWGNGRIFLPPETDYESTPSSFALKKGWIWGNNQDAEEVILQVAGMQIVLARGSFALEKLPQHVGWFYLAEGEAIIHTADNREILVTGGEMVALSDQFTPVPYNETISAVLHPWTESPLQNNWEPTLAAQTRDRLARIGISIAQVITFVTYMLVLIVIAALLIGGIYSIWKNTRKTLR